MPSDASGRCGSRRAQPLQARGRAKMAPKPIPISTARQIAGQHGLHALVCIYEMPDGRLGYTSYGRDRSLCDRAKTLADAAFDAVEKARQRLRKAGDGTEGPEMAEGGGVGVR